MVVSHKCVVFSMTSSQPSSSFMFVRLSHSPLSSYLSLHSYLVFAVHYYFVLVLGVVRASNIFPILSAILLLMGGLCIAASRFYRSKRNIILGAGILFVAAGNLRITCAYMCGKTACVYITCPNCFHFFICVRWCLDYFARIIEVFTVNLRLGSCLY